MTDLPYDANDYFGNHGYNYYSDYKNKHLEDSCLQVLLRVLLSTFIVISSIVIVFLVIIHFSEYLQYNEFNNNKSTCIIKEIVEVNCYYYGHEQNLIGNVEFTETNITRTLILRFFDYERCLFNYNYYNNNEIIDCYIFKDNELYINDSFNLTNIIIFQNSLIILAINGILTILMICDFSCRHNTSNCTKLPLYSNYKKNKISQMKFTINQLKKEISTQSVIIVELQAKITVLEAPPPSPPSYDYPSSSEKID